MNYHTPVYLADARRSAIGRFGGGLKSLSPAALALWRQGHFLNFNGLTRWISTIWPFLALPYLFLVSRRL